MNFLHNLEVFLITRTLQPLAHFTQRKFAFDCFDWAALITVCSFVCIGYQSLLVAAYQQSIDPVNAIWAITLAWFCSGLFLDPDHNIYVKKIRAYKARTSGEINPFQKKWKVSFVLLIPCLASQVGWLVFQDHGISQFINALTHEIYWLALAFASCTPLSPSETGRQKKHGA